jgi:hypothetical protein
MDDANAAGAGSGRRDGCLRPALLILFLALGTVCCLLGGLIAAATQPGGITLGLDTFSLSIETRLDTFRISYVYQFSGLDGPCVREDSLVVVYNPLEVRRIPGCHCTISGPGFLPVVILCEEQGLR